MCTTTLLRSLLLASLTAGLSACVADVDQVAEGDETQPYDDEIAYDDEADELEVEGNSQGLFQITAPDLVFKNALGFLQTLDPNKPASEQLAPGYYTTFTFKNEGNKATGPFKLRVSGERNTTIEEFTVPDLAPGATTSISAFHAPGSCWTYTATADANNTVGELFENNNVGKFGVACLPTVILK